MQKILMLCLAALAFSTLSVTALAQNYAYHPAISDNFSASLGYMRSANSFKIKADDPTRPDIPGEEIDFNDTLGVSNHSTFFNGQLRWKFGKSRKWVLAGQYFSNNAKGSVVLTEDIEWDGDMWREGSFVDSGVKLAITRLFIGRSFFKNDRNDFGVGVGIHNFDLKTFIEGEIKIGGETTGFQEASISESQILPNVGA